MRGHSWFRAEPTGETGIHTGRLRYRTTCECGKELHEATTGPSAQFEMHQDRIARGEER